MKWYREGEELLTFDDVLVRPAYSRLDSRFDADPTLEIVIRGEDITVSPIIAANMIDIATPEMITKLSELNCIAPAHRNQSIDNEIRSVENAKIKALSVGLNERDRTKACIEVADVLFLELAHAYSKRALEEIGWIRETFDGMLVVGNVGTLFACAELYENGVDVCKCGIGSGCFSADTRVLMSNGTYKNICDLKIHDRVINGYGTPVEVTRVMFNGYKKILKYKHNVWHKNVYVTKNHEHFIGDYSSCPTADNHRLVTILDKKEKSRGLPSKYKWESIGNLESLFTFLSPRRIKFELPEKITIDFSEYYKSYRGYKGKVKSKLKYECNYELGYIFGLFLGDGTASLCTTKRKQKNGKVTKNTCSNTTWYLHKDQIPIIEKLENCLKSIGINTRRDTKSKKNVTQVIVRNNWICRFLKRFGKLQDKHLPEELMCLDLEYNRGLFDGLVDSDGGYEKKTDRVSCSNASERIMELFSFCGYIVNGYFPSMTMMKRSIGNLKGTKIENIKQGYKGRTVKHPEYLLTKDFQISRLNKGGIKEQNLYTPVYDIEVNCPSHSFIANNIIVHNSICETRRVTGCGVPQFSAIVNCSSVEKTEDQLLIADGGIRNSGDIVKCLAAGSNFVMVGSLLAGTDESAGHGTGSRPYRGMASRDVQVGKHGRLQKGIAPEGISAEVPYKGPVENVIENLLAGIRQGMSMVGARTLEELRDNAIFQRVSPSTYQENLPHILNRK